MSLKKLCISAIAVGMVAGLMSSASAALITLGNELDIGTTYEVYESGASYGVYLGYYNGNVGSNNDNMATTILNVLEKNTVIFNDKDDVIEVLKSALTVKSSDEQTSGFNVASTIKNSKGEVTGGTWTSDLGISVYAVKGGNGYTAWYVDDVIAPKTGSFTTYGLKNGDDYRNLSHLVGYAGVQPADVPEPSILSLLGLSLLGLGFIRRKKN
ncbi:MAG: PEP-CTERM sorting domain-containing protein [Fibrobacter sp.]|nr:PEP-CTERM sorting domain-containing protein [Fibrobacter sp.]